MQGKAELPSDSASDENPEVHLWHEQAYAELANLKLTKNKGLLYVCTAAQTEEYLSLTKPLKNYLRRPDHDVTHINAFCLVVYKTLQWLCVYDRYENLTGGVVAIHTGFKD